MMQIAIVSRRRRLKPRRADLARLARELMRAAAGRDGRGAAPFRLLTLHLLDDAGMVEANRAVCGRDYATDVIAVAYEPLPGGPAGAEAEVFLNAQRAAEEGAARPRTRAGRAWGAAGELALYLAHACDHLHGGRDATRSGRARMRRRELRWLRGPAAEALAALRGRETPRGRE
jgi:ssRNA-specific RNase YbeY (16S rRNA maturation enzyme)